MEIQVDVTLTLSEDFVENSFYTEDGFTPTVKDIVHRAIEDIDGSHRFGVSYEAKNVTINKLEVRG
tara:strand:+ start:6835 stop:7032 length:198 start_codon:yes stop_codon:yes gene_type:complete